MAINCDDGVISSCYPKFVDRNQLAKEIFKISHRTGHFVLRSGQTSNEYFDKYRFESQPQLLQAIANHLSKLVAPSTQALAGLELGGVPLATALSLATGLPTLFVRKEAKAYGTCQIAEGLDFKSKRILIVEDVVTTGGQVIESVRELRRQGADVLDVVCVILRNTEAHKFFAAENLRLLPLFTMEELKTHA